MTEILEVPSAGRGIDVLAIRSAGGRAVEAKPLYARPVVPPG